MEDIVNNLNENKFFIGLMMICVTIGGRFIITELTEEQKKIIHNKVFRRLIIFSAFFMSTRDIFTAFILTIIFTIVISELFNGEDNMQFLSPEDDKENEKELKLKKIDETIQSLNDLKNDLSMEGLQI
jgi:hypothetical protein